MSGFGGSLGTSRGRLELDTSQADSAAEGLERRLNNMENAGGGIEKLTQQFGRLGVAMTGIGTSIVGALAVPITMGTKAAWSQVDAVEQATVALRAYGGSAEEVDAQLQKMVAYARSDLGVLFQRQDLFAAAQGLTVMGAETSRLSDYVEIMSRSVGVGATSWTELTRIIGRVGSTGQLTAYEFDALTKSGYKLDRSLRGTTVTWDELFEALDQGIPADAMAGQAQTIRGMMIRLQSSIRNVGLAFLGVDKDTSKFIEGGLGDTLKNGLDQARRAFIHLQAPAAAFGNALAMVARIVSMFIEAIISLPTAITAPIISFAGFAGAAMMIVGPIMAISSGIGMELIPNLFGLRDKVGGVIGMFGNFKDGLLTLKGIVSGSAGELGQLPGVFGKIGSSLDGVIAKAKAGELSFKSLTSGMMGLAKAHPILAGLSIAAGAFALAYKTNFLGFGDAVDNVKKKVGSLADSFMSAFRSTGESASIAEDQVASLAKATHVVDGVTVYTAFKSNAEGELEAVGEIIESYANADGTTAQVLIKGDDGEYWATIDLATGEIFDAQIDVKANVDDRGMIQKIIDGLDAMKIKADELGIGWLNPVIGGLQTLLGWVDKVAGVVGTFVSRFRSLSNVMNPISALFSTISGMLKGLDFGSFQSGMDGVIRGLDTLSRGFVLITAALTAFWDGLRKIWTGNFAAGISQITSAVSLLGTGIRVAFNGVADIFDGLGDIVGKLADRFPAFGDTLDAVADRIRAFADIARNVGTLISAIFSGDWSSAGKALAGIFTGMLETVRSGFSIIGNLFSELGSLLNTGISKAINGLSKRFPAFGNSIKKVGSVISNVIGVFQKLGQAIADLMSGDFRGVWDNLTSALGHAIKAIASMMTTLPTILFDTFRAIPWVALWNGLVDGAKAAWDGVVGFFKNTDWAGIWNGIVLALAQTMASVMESISGTWASIKETFNSIDWAGIWNGILDALSGTMTAVINTLQSAFGAIDWLALVQGAAAIPGAILGFLGDLGSTVWGWITNAAAFVASTWPDLVAGASGLASAAIGLMTDLGSAVLGWITAGAEYVAESWPDLVAGAADLASKAVELFGELGELVLGWIQDAAQTADAIVTAIFGTVSGIPEAVVALWGTLADAVGPWLSNALQTVSSVVGAIFPDMSGVAQALVDLWTGLTEAVGTFLGNAAQTVSTVIGAVFPNMGSVASTLVEKFGSLFAQVTSWLLKAARNSGQILALVFGSVSGIAGSLVGKFGDLAAEVGGWIKTGAKKAADIVSGVFGNLGDLAGAVKEALAGIGDGIVGAVSGAIDKAKEIWDSRPKWLGGSGGGDDASVEVPDPGGLLPKDFNWDATEYVSVIETAIVTAINAASADAIGGAFENWVWRAVGTLTGKLDDDMKALAVTMDTGFQNAVGQMSGVSLGNSIKAWISKAVAGMQSSVDAEMLTLARAMDTGIGTAMASFSGVSLSTALSGWITKAAGKISESADAVGLTVARALDTAVTGGLGALSGASLGTAIGSWVGRGVTNASSAVTTAVNGMMTKFQSDVSKGLDSARSTWDSHRTSVMSIVSNFSSQVGSTTSSMMSTLQNVWMTGLSKIQSSVQGSMSTVQSVVNSSMSLISGYVKTNIQAMDSAITSGMQAFVSGVSQGMSSAVSVTRDGMSRIVSAISGYGSSMYSNGQYIGSQLGNGIAAGIEGAIWRVVNAANRIVAEANRAARAAAQISSPSRLFAIIGQFMTAGLAGGMDSPMSLNKVIGSTKNVISAAADTVRDGVIGNIQVPDVTGRLLESLQSRPIDPFSVTGDSSSMTNVVVNMIVEPTQEYLERQAKVARAVQFVDNWQKPEAISQYLGS